MKAKIQIYDTTLRDGAQAEDISFSVADKIKITEKLDQLGVSYIEGGWPGANPKDSEYFEKVYNLQLKNATVVAFGSTHNPKKKVEEDEKTRELIRARTNVITIFGKTWDFQVKEALKISLKKNLRIIADSVNYLKRHVSEVFFDAEHFFDGYKNNSHYATECLKKAAAAGANMIILCDTNGGCLPHEVGQIVKKVKAVIKIPLGIHAHNDTECAVANSLMAVRQGVVQVQGTINGFGERCGNANLCSIIPNIQYKLGIYCLKSEQLRLLRETSRFVNETANLGHFKRQPYVGESAFAHKGGVHVSAVIKHSATYEHIKPELVGNKQRILISDQAGRANVLEKVKAFNLNLKSEDDLLKVKEVTDKLKKLENEGYEFEGADASFELLLRKTFGHNHSFFRVISFKVITENKKNNQSESSAIVLVRVGKIHPEPEVALSTKGPVNAMDKALRRALVSHYPSLREVYLVDYKVRVLQGREGTGSKIRVLCGWSDGKNTWNTVGVSENIILASEIALVDSYRYKLLKHFS